jgi:hypothetical protein
MSRIVARCKMPAIRTLDLDLFCLNRPFNGSHQVRVQLDAEAVIGLIRA